MLKYTTSDQTYFMFRAEMSTSNPKINGPSQNGAEIGRASCRERV